MHWPRGIVIRSSGCSSSGMGLGIELLKSVTVHGVAMKSSTAATFC
jgi:hypothetical protein